MPDDRRRLPSLRVALGFRRLPPRAPELVRPPTARQLARRRLAGGWLHRIGYDLDLRQYGDGRWRATFYVTGIAHSILGGSARETTVWRAVQLAGWDALARTPSAICDDGSR